MHSAPTLIFSATIFFYQKKMTWLQIKIHCSKWLKIYIIIYWRFIYQKEKRKEKKSVFDLFFFKTGMPFSRPRYCGVISTQPGVHGWTWWWRIGDQILKLLICWSCPTENLIHYNHYLRRIISLLLLGLGYYIKNSYTLQS